MPAYYNEIDPYCCQWLRNLIDAGHIPFGVVDSRPIQEVRGDDLNGYDQCHFFAGIGGWAIALKLAGWGDRPVWTGSCPCQPFSVGGKQQGFRDERHLWPIWFRLARECKPSVITGEQVSDAIAFGWLDEIAHDLEGEGYAFASAVLPAYSVGSPHKRCRLFFVADSGSTNTGRRPSDIRRSEGAQEMGNPWAFANWQGGLNNYGRLDDGLSALMAKRIANGFGNAIVPQVAAEFVAAYLDTSVLTPTPILP